MPNPVRIAANATTARVIGADDQCKAEIHRLLSYRVNGAEHMAAFQNRHWDGRSSFFAYEQGLFPAGFIHHVTAGLRKAGYLTQLVRAEAPEPLDHQPPVDDFGFEPRYDYQLQVVEKLIRHRQIIARVATGGGKSRIARLAMRRLNTQTLFLTTRGILMYQMHESLEKMTGEPVAVLGDGEWGIPYTKPDGTEGRKLSQYTVGMVQTLAQRLADPERRAAAEAVLARFKFVILEEAHEVSSESFWDVMGACKNAHYRLALTATPFMKDDEEANMRLLGCSGPVAIDITEKMLIERGILARPYFKYIKLPPSARPKRLYKSTPYAGAYKYGIVEHEYRNKLIAVEVARAVKYGLSAMVLVQRKEHGRALKELFARVGVRAEFIFGENSQKERKRVIGALARREIDVLIGSTILDVGVDVPAVGMIVLAGGGKAEVGTRQRIGRGLREKRDGSPNVALIVDVSDDINNHLKAHAKERRTIVEQTPGFAEGIVDDFDFEALGFVRKAA